jgi:hypothetical protein
MRGVSSDKLYCRKVGAQLLDQTVTTTTEGIILTTTSRISFPQLLPVNTVYDTRLIGYPSEWYSGRVNCALLTHGPICDSRSSYLEMPNAEFILLDSFPAFIIVMFLYRVVSK